MSLSLSFHLSGKAMDGLRKLEHTGASESIAVAECLSNIAENGEESAEDEFLITCAEEIREAAQFFINHMKRK